MKKIFLLMCLIILMLVGCSTKSEPQDLSNMNIEEVKETISKGLSKKEVKELFGQPSGVTEENSLKDVPDNPEY